MASRGGATRPNGPNAGSKICQFKLVLLGESAVGKSSLVLRFVKGQFHEFQESTIGGEYRVTRADSFIPLTSNWYVCVCNLLNCAFLQVAKFSSLVIIITAVGSYTTDRLSPVCAEVPSNSCYILQCVPFDQIPTSLYYHSMEFVYEHCRTPLSVFQHAGCTTTRIVLIQTWSEIS